MKSPKTVNERVCHGKNDARSCKLLKPRRTRIVHSLEFLSYPPRKCSVAPHRTGATPQFLMQSAHVAQLLVACCDETNMIAL